MASDTSSSPSTPMVLTPTSTGSTPLDPTAAVKKARRQTAFYPNTNSANKPTKPFSRSAAKRESVMALGSIEHLQHYFTKTGIEAKKNAKAGKSHHGLVPVFGGLTHSRTDSNESLSIMDLPPSPAAPQHLVPVFPPYVKTYEMDPESLLPGVIDDLSDVAFVWRIDQPLPQQGSPNHLAVAGAKHDVVEVLTVLKTTTRAIRSVRNYLLSLPDESAGTIRAQFRSRHLPGSFRPAVSSSLSKTNTASSSDLRAAGKEKDKEKEDPLSLIRKSALEVLTVLRDLEERSRLPLSDDAYDAQSDGGSKGGHSRVASPSMQSDELSPDEHEHEGDLDTSVAFSLVQVNGQSVPVWEEEEDNWNLDEDAEKEKKEGWDEKLVLGSGWLYQQDVRLESLSRERAAVSAYLDTVDDILFEGKNSASSEGAKRERGWERERRKATEKGTLRSRSRANRRAASRERGDDMSRPMVTTPAATGGDKARRRVSVGMFEMMGNLRVTEEPEEMGEIGEEGEDSDGSVDDELLPEWARRGLFSGDDLGRAHALITAFLPPPLLTHLAPSTSRTAFLDSLSSGQLLCLAYNNCVRKSKKPWGYISRDGIHDIIALEQAVVTADGEQVKKGWTFRRIDNLRLWAGALKLRYLLPIIAAPNAGSHTPASGTPASSPVAPRFKPEQPPVIFDAKVVARQDPGWEDILAGVVVRWMQQVVSERRGEGQ
ncbi:hypothetical protein MKEN_01011400 [Mycena kentingensis (nom. inval.)]|nr:hypothetical protein MKEN_01011400 [Mycena kentingensis (nom. inval.)]